MNNHLDIASVVIYLTMFSSSLVFVAIAEKYLYKKDGTLFKSRQLCIGLFFLSIAVLIPCLFAAFRGANVGGDVGTYIVDNFEYGKKESVGLSEFRKYVNLQIPEVLFAVIMFTCCKLGSIQLLFFIIEFLVIVPLTIAMVKSRSKGSLVLGFVVFYFLFYNFSLSGMRQSIAMSFVLLAVVLAVEKKYIRTIILIVIAQLFHSSTILVASLIVVCFLINCSRKKNKLSLIFAGSLVFVYLSFSTFSTRIAAVVSRLNPRYGYYISYYFHNGINIGDIPSTDIIIKTSLVIIPLVMIKAMKKYSFVDDMMLAFVLLGRYFVLFNGVFYEALRIAYFFDLFIILYMFRCLTVIKKSSNRFVMICSSSIISFVYWIYFIMYIGGYGTNLLTFGD